MNDARPNVYYLCLPADLRLPRRCRTKTIPLCPTINPLQRQQFKPEFIHFESREEMQVWSRWITSHQHLLFCWGLSAEACQDVTHLVRRCKWEAATLWLRRATRLMLLSAGATANARNSDRDLSVKGLMGIIPESFDNELSSDYLLLTEAIAEMERILNTNEGNGTNLPRDFFEARLVFNKIYATVMKNAFIKSGKSPYIYEMNVRQLASAERYDRAFGVLRMQMMYIEDYRFFLLNSIGAARNELLLVSIDPEKRAWIEDGNKLMLAIVGELLDPPSYQPNA